MKRSFSLKQYSTVFLVLFSVGILLAISVSNIDNPNILAEIEKPSTQADQTYWQWSTTLGTSNVDYAEDVWADKWGGIYTVGTINSNTSNPQLILTRYSEWNLGAQDWNVTWSNGSIIQGNSVWGVYDGYYIYTAGTTPTELVLIKWFYNGTQIWNASWNLNSNFGKVYSIWASNEVIYMSGVYIDDLLLIKWDGNGNQVWNTTWGGPGWEQGVDIWGFGDQIYTTGSTSSYGKGLNDSLIVKWDSEGNQIWNRTSGTAFEENHTSISGFEDEIYVCGNIWNATNSTPDIFIMKWDSEGNSIWNQTWQTQDEDVAYSIWANEFYIHIVGTTTSWDAPFKEMVISKYSYNGILVENTFPSWNAEYEYIPSSVFGINERLFITGWVNLTNEEPKDYDQFLFNFYTYQAPPVPNFPPIEPNPSLNGTYIVEWQDFVESEGYRLYRDIYPILDVSGMTPYLELTNTSIIESNMPEGTYFYKVSCIVKGVESSPSQPRVVEVDLPDPDDKIPGFNVFLLLSIAAISVVSIIKKNLESLTKDFHNRPFGYSTSNKKNPDYANSN
jgi:hypothetical protein